MARTLAGACAVPDVFSPPRLAEDCRRGQESLVVAASRQSKCLSGRRLAVEVALVSALHAYRRPPMKQALKHPVDQEWARKNTPGDETNGRRLTLPAVAAATNGGGGNGTNGAGTIAGAPANGTSEAQRRRLSDFLLAER